MFVRVSSLYFVFKRLFSRTIPYCQGGNTSGTSDMSQVAFVQRSTRVCVCRQVRVSRNQSIKEKNNNNVNH